MLRGHIYLAGRPFALVTKGWSNKDRIEIVHTDNLGTPRAMTRLDQQPITWERLQTPFGLTHLETGDPDLVQQLRFPGQLADEATGLDYNYYRDYDPALGRYTTPDPNGLAGGDMNLYAYVAGDPVNWSDPYGLDETRWINKSGGRSLYDYPTHGNWGGQCWSGGQYSCGSEGMGDAPPTDSADECYRNHDAGYFACRFQGPDCIRWCDDNLVRCLEALDDDSTKWPQPPRPGTEDDSENYRIGAIIIFR